jgi:uncharacterized protein (DUF1800 family)
MRVLRLATIAALVSGCAHPNVASVPTGARAPLAYTPSRPAERELLPDEQVQQVLNRLAFGARPGDAAKVRAIGVDAWIQAQLNPQVIPDSVTDRLLTRYASLNVPTADLVQDYTVLRQARNQQKQQATKDSTANRRGIVMAATGGDPDKLRSLQLAQRAVPELQAATLTRAATSERQLDEVMVNFWENHFSIFSGKGQQERLFLTEFDRDVIRPNALGKFRDLLGAVAHSPAMLFYLDNWESQADSLHPTLAGARGRARARLSQAVPQRRGLNENYARELMELHTLGVDGGYTQQDVIEVARALTGWSLAIAQGGQFIFRPEAHDAGEKVVLGHKLAPGRGEVDGEDVLDVVAHHPATARFITTKLARHFVSDDPPAVLIDRCSSVFTKTDGDIRQTVGCVITSPEFFSRAAYRSKVKTPFEVVASALRAVQAQPDATPRSAQAVAQLGQPIFGHQTPEGWPDRGEAWMNTGAILGRINFGLTMAAGRVPGVVMGHVPELDQLQNAPRDAQVDGVIKLFFGGQVSTDTRQVLASGENPLMKNSMSPVAMGGLTQVIGLALGAPEFQRR